jgi:putative membrane protein
MKLMIPVLGLLAFKTASTEAWAPPSGASFRLKSLQRLAPAGRSRSSPQLWWGQSDSNDSINNEQHSRLASFDPLDLSPATMTPSGAEQASEGAGWDVPCRALLLGAVAMGSTPEMAMAASSDAIPSALAAYGHYLSIIVIVASIMTERLTVKPAMSIEEEKLLGAADILTGVAGALLAVSGYYRATAYGKGWDFYSHEPIFWLKMTFLGIFGALSLFPTITIIQRTVKIQQEGTIEPMSEELAKRMTTVLNAELTALAFIPLTATLMARGVGYMGNDFPTQIVGPSVFGVVTAGAVYKYVKDALTWKEPSTMIED